MSDFIIWILCIFLFDYRVGFHLMMYFKQLYEKPLNTEMNSENNF